MQGIGSWVGKSHSLVRKDKNGRRSRSRTRSKPHGHALSAARSEPDKTRSASQRRKHMAAVAGLVELHSGSRVASPSKIYPDPARSSTALIENGNDAVTGRIPAEHYYGQLSSLGGAYYMDDTEYDLQVCEQAEKEEGCSADGVHRNPYGERNDPKPYPPSPQAAGKSPHFLQQFRSAGLVQPQKPGPASPNRPVTSILSSTHSQRLGNAVLHSESPFGPPSQESSYYTTSSAPISAQMPPQSSALSNSSILKMDSSQQPTPPQPAMLNPPLPGIGNPGMQNKNAYQSPPLEASSSVVTRPSLATVPRVERQESNGVQWIAFEYSRDRIKMEYTIRCDVESVNVDNLSQEFKTKNCVYPRACCSKDQYRGNRLVYETECNAGGWALAELNPALRGKRGLIQRAVDIQDIYRDPHHPSIWNVAAARMINVHILDPTSCEEVTHIVPPPIPMDAYEYVEKRLPFFVVNEQIDDRLNGGRFDDIKSDLRK
ncbi:uncharacterized protein PFLUO_LOCUS297 [Penicillium psychrofluorescens]|uniref:uncharacterized protein n=1 Tax=Penicillium psychrofluorescens TaxID=3158075 RepID=UPI003CCCC6F6